MVANRGGTSTEKVGWKRDGIDGQKVFLTILMSFLLGPERSGVDTSTPVHPVESPLVANDLKLEFQVGTSNN